MTPSRVEQVFLEPWGSGTKVMVVLEDEAGGRTRERYPLADSNPAQAARVVARQLGYRGIVPARKVRLRVGSANALRDDEELLQSFLTQLQAPG